MSEKRKKPRTKKSKSIQHPPDITMNIPIAQHTSNSNYYKDASIMEDQDYEYELSLIADMEKREKEKQEKEEQERAAILEERDFHIKHVLRRLKLGYATTDTEKGFIIILEKWMDSQDTVLHSNLSPELHSYLTNQVRIPNDTKEYLKQKVL